MGFIVESTATQHDLLTKYALLLLKRSPMSIKQITAEIRKKIARKQIEIASLLRKLEEDGFVHRQSVEDQQELSVFHLTDRGHTRTIKMITEISKGHEATFPLDDDWFGEECAQCGEDIDHKTRIKRKSGRKLLYFCSEMCSKAFFTNEQDL